ncbi:ubiquitin-related domain-containing protein [Dipodascopsis uninucleata]
MMASSNSGVFETQVETAVSRSVKEQLPLLVFVADDSDESQRWIRDIIFTSEVITILRNHSVSVRLQQGSTEANYFGQIFPIVNVPALYIINNGQLIQYIEGSVDLESFICKLRESLLSKNGSGGENSGAVSGENTQIENQNGGHRAYSEPLPDCSTVSSTSNIGTTRQELSTNDGPLRNDDEFAHEEQRNPTSQSKRNIQNEQNADSSNSQHERIRRKRIEESEERQRILKLLRDDKEERKARSRKSEFEGSFTSTDDSDQNIKNGEHFRQHTESALAIRLFDGSSIKHRFPVGSTLIDVRSWIDSVRTDGDGAYIIMCLIPHKVFTSEDEHLSLVELGLHPTATLILKPINDSSSITASMYNRLQSTLTSILTTAGSYLGYGNSNQSERFSDNDGRARMTSRSRNLVMRPRTIQDVENDDADRRTYNGNQLNLEDD